MGSISRSLLYICIHLSKLIPKFGVNALLLWSIYTHLSICLRIFLPQNADSQSWIILSYILALAGLSSYALCVWSYVKVVLTGPGTTRQLKEEYWCMENGIYGDNPNDHLIKKKGFNGKKTDDYISSSSNIMNDNDHHQTDHDDETEFLITDEERYLVSLLLKEYDQKDINHQLGHPLQRDNGGNPPVVPHASSSSSSSSSGVDNDITVGSTEPIYRFPFPIETYTAKDNGKLRYCTKCELPKPDRTHHCSSCHECVLKMDHHCPWFATCIGFQNHKFFVQFLTWVVIHCFWCFLSSGLCVWAWLSDINQGVKSPGFENDEYMSLNWIALLVVSFVFGFAVMIFDGFSIYLLIQNRSTLENMESVKYMTVVPSYQFRFMPAITSRTHGNLYDLGKLENVKQVMGYNWYEWIFPVTNQCFKARGNGAGAGAKGTRIKFPSHVYFPSRLADFYGTNFPINKPRWMNILKDGMKEQQRLRQHNEHQDRMREFRQQEIRHNMQNREAQIKNDQPGKWNQFDFEMDDF